MIENNVPGLERVYVQEARLIWPQNSERKEREPLGIEVLRAVALRGANG